MNKKTRFFAKSPFIMDKMEKKYYTVLLHAVDLKYYVWPKVHLTDLLHPANDIEDSFYEKYCQLSDKHVDFVLCENERFQPILVIRFRRMLRHPDEITKKEESILKEILASAGIPLLIESATEIDSYRKNTQYEAMRVRINNAIKNQKGQ